MLKCTKPILKATFNLFILLNQENNNWNIKLQSEQLETSTLPAFLLDPQITREHSKAKSESMSN